MIRVKHGGGHLRRSRTIRAASAAVFTLCVATVTAHEVTRRGFDRSLDPREAVALATATSLRQALTTPSAENPCRLSVRLVDAESRRPVPGLVRVVAAGNRAIGLPGLVSRGLKLRANHPGKDWHVVAEPGVLLVPREPLRLEAFFGLETEMASVPLDLRGKAAAEMEIPLRRIHAAARRGWRSGNTHLHVRGLSQAQADEYLRTIPVGDGLDLVFVSYLERAGADRDYISNAYTKADLESLSSPALMFGNGEEHRHNFGAGGEGYGHVMFLDLPALVRPVSVGPGITGGGPDYPPLRQGIDRARAQGATILWCHNAFGFEHAPNWLSGRIDAHNIFDGGTQGSYVQTYYRFLNLGMKVPFSTGTDWFMYDFSRVYVRMDEPLTVRGWLGGLAAGRTFITNGPLLELTVDGREIGETIALSGAAAVDIRARAVGRCDFQALELVHDGRMVLRVPTRASGGHFGAELNHRLAVDKSGWVAVRTPGGAVDTEGLAALPPNLPFRTSGSGRNELGEALFAHTSAIYLDLAGRPAFDRQAAEALRRDIEASARAIEARARFENDEQRREVSGIYREGLEWLRRKGVP